METISLTWSCSGDYNKLLIAVKKHNCKIVCLLEWKAYIEGNLEDTQKLKSDWDNYMYWGKFEDEM